MTKMEMVQQALRELGEVSPAELSAFVAQRFGTPMEPKVIPLFVASLKDKERLEQARREARAAALRQQAEENLLRCEAS